MSSVNIKNKTGFTINTSYSLHVIRRIRALTSQEASVTRISNTSYPEHYIRRLQGRNYVPHDEWEHFECTRLNNDDDAIRVNQEWLDDYEPMNIVDDDFRDIDDYLVSKDAPFIVNEEEGRFKERR
ncbi:hypothetical protein Tco_1378852 [Tanacetum coccineum]